MTVLIITERRVVKMKNLYEVIKLGEFHRCDQADGAFTEGISNCKIAHIAIHNDSFASSIGFGDIFADFKFLNRDCKNLEQAKKWCQDKLEEVIGRFLEYGGKE